VIFGSVCSGIEAASVAWHPLGWRAAFFAEVDRFPSAVLAHRFPAVPNAGDFTGIKGREYGPIDVLVGGTPCQSFSIAGLRSGLADDRGNLALEFLRLADRSRARWLVWENVPGVLSSNGGRDFGTILGGMGELGYGLAYRVLDAQYFGVPQRRRRVFVVGYLGDWRRAAAVFFDRYSLQGHSAPRRKTRESPSAAIRASAARRGGIQDECGPGLIGFNNTGAGHWTRAASAATVRKGTESGGGGARESTLLAFSCKDYAQDAGDTAPTLRAMHEIDGHANGGGQIAIAIQERAVCENPDAGPDGAGFRTDGQAYTLEARSVPQAVAFKPSHFTRGKDGAPSETFPPLSADADKGDQDPLVLAQGATVRRLTPRECERLQGFPDDYTLIPWRGKLAADGPRYKALGNSMAVPVMRWIGTRIGMVDALPQQKIGD
jgi:DNA (cytosine-5)-methyltransferase 1